MAKFNYEAGSSVKDLMISVVRRWQDRLGSGILDVLGIYPYRHLPMRQLTACFSLLTLMLSLATTATAADREGVPGRRVGGGTRWTAPRLKPPHSMQGKISAMAFASRTGLPMSLRFKAIYG
ncbi:MAG TPA: hypothetical protein V6C50_09420 [Crinalium sp.]